MDRLRETDQKISSETELFRVCAGEEYNEILRACQTLFGETFGVFLAGSLSLALRTGDAHLFRFGDDPSDIDLWIIVPDNSSPRTLPEENQGSFVSVLRERAQMLPFFDLVCVPYPHARSAWSIKVMTVSTARMAMSRTPSLFRVFRDRSLSAVKQTDRFSGMRDDYEIKIQEEQIPGGYVWSWANTLNREDDVVLSDLQSCFLFGGILSDGVCLAPLRVEFLKEFESACRACQEVYRDADVSRLWGYFARRFPSLPMLLSGCGQEKRKGRQEASQEEVTHE